MQSAELDARIRTMSGTPSSRSLLLITVGDEPHIRKMMRDFLERSGFVVTEVDTLVDAHDEIRRCEHDLVLLHYLEGPRHQGFRVAAVRELLDWSTSPLFVIEDWVAWSSMEEHEELDDDDDDADEERERRREQLYRSLGVAEYLRPPFSVRDLTGRIRAHLT